MRPDVRCTCRNLRTVHTARVLEPLLRGRIWIKLKARCFMPGKALMTDLQPDDDAIRVSEVFDDCVGGTQ